MPKIVYTDSYIRRAKKSLKRHPDMLGQYEKTLRLMELNASHPSLRLHRLAGSLSELYSISINVCYGTTLDLLIKEDTIIPVYIGAHDEVY